MRTRRKGKVVAQEKEPQQSTALRVSSRDRWVETVWSKEGYVSVGCLLVCGGGWREVGRAAKTSARPRVQVRLSAAPARIPELMLFVPFLQLKPVFYAVKFTCWLFGSRIEVAWKRSAVATIDVAQGHRHSHVSCFGTCEIWDGAHWLDQGSNHGTSRMTSKPLRKFIAARFVFIAHSAINISRPLPQKSLLLVRFVSVMHSCNVIYRGTRRVCSRRTECRTGLAHAVVLRSRCK